MFFRIQVLYKIVLMLIIINVIIFFYAYNGPSMESKKENVVQTNQGLESDFETTIPILVLACDRPSYLNRTLTSIFKYHPYKANPRSTKFPVLVSMACDNKETEEIVNSFRDKLTAYLIYSPNTKAIQENLERSSFDNSFMIDEKMLKYGRISDHYRTAVNWAFSLSLGSKIFKIHNFSNYNFANHNAIIIFEDDLELSPDIFEYFSATYPILQKDPSLYCVSAWNDHGSEEHVNKSAAEQLYRTDFFSGLGWMLLKSLWLELEPEWADSLWDEYMRLESNRKDRQCIRPEITRTFTFGEIGVSDSQFYYSHLKHQFLNRKYVNFRKIDLNYLSKSRYYKYWIEQIFVNTTELNLLNITQMSMLPRKIRLKYSSSPEYTSIAQSFNLLSDLKDDVPRMAYKGVVTFIYKQSRIFLYPENLLRRVNLKRFKFANTF